MTLKTHKLIKKELKSYIKAIQNSIQSIEKEAERLGHEYNFEDDIWDLSATVDDLKYTLFDDPDLKIEITTNEN